MYTLGIDTSSPLGSVALLRAGDVVAQVQAEVQARHGETILSHLESVLATAGIEFSEVGLLSVGAGPGSFTGLRVGVSTAKGLAFASGVPIVAVGSLQAIARAMPPGPRVVMVDAYKSEVYSAVYGAEDSGELLLTLRHGSIEETVEQASDCLEGMPAALAGSGCRRYAETLGERMPPSWTLLDPSYDHPRAEHVAAIGRTLFLERGPDAVASLEPLYVRPSDAKLPGGVTLVREA